MAEGEGLVWSCHPAWWNLSTCWLFEAAGPVHNGAAVVLPADVVYQRRRRDDPRVGAPCFQDNSIPLRLLEPGIDVCSRSAQE
jgi:hypothetical protein